MSILNEKPFAISVKDLYLKIIKTKELVWGSSMIWIYWFLSKIFSGKSETIIIAFLTLTIISIIYIMVKKIPPDSGERWRECYIKTFNLPGSILFLFLSVNSFLKISPILAYEFLNDLREFEETYSMTLFGSFIMFIFFLTFFHFLTLLNKILNPKLYERKNYS